MPRGSQSRRNRWRLQRIEQSKICIVQWFLFVPVCTSDSSSVFLEISHSGEFFTSFYYIYCTVYKIELHYYMNKKPSHGMKRHEEKLPLIVQATAPPHRFVLISSAKRSALEMGDEGAMSPHVAIHFKIVVWNEVCFWKPRKRLRRLWWIELRIFESPPFFLTIVVHDQEISQSRGLETSLSTISAGSICDGRVVVPCEVEHTDSS